MEEEDNEFFVLVLGVLAAIILVISWWFTTGGTSVTAQPVVPEEEVAYSDDDAAAPAEEAEPEPAPVQDEPVEDEPVEEEPVEEIPAPQPTNVFTAIADRPDLSVVADLLRAEGLDAALAGTGPFTVLAPSNDAVSTAAGSDTTLAMLETAPSSVLTYHVIPGRYTAADLQDVLRGSRPAELLTLQGEPITLSPDGENIVINGTTIIVGDAAEADNGFVYTLDNVLVPPVETLNTLVGLDPILFASGSATIDQESFATLDSLAEILAGNDVGVSIEGHTDSTGDPVLNQNLSQARARSVLNYLVANGIDESRLSATGFGPTKPVADNNTLEGQALNRRIEFTLESS